MIPASFDKLRMAVHQLAPAFALAPRPSIAATELVPAEVFETLEDLLGGAVDRAPACAIAFDDEKGLPEAAAAEATSSDVLKPRVTSLAVCAACANEARAWDAANATRAATAYLGATIEVRRIREPPREEELRRKPPKASEGEARPETSFFDGEEKNKTRRLRKTTPRRWPPIRLAIGNGGASRPRRGGRARPSPRGRRVTHPKEAGKRRRSSVATDRPRTRSGAL